MPKMLVRHPKADYSLPTPDEIRKVLGVRVRQLRKQFNMSQKELAVNIGKHSAAYIAFIETGERNISATDLIRLARHFKVNLSTFSSPQPK